MADLVRYVVAAMTFDVCFAKLIKHEGGFVDHKSDPGGATNFGITQAVARANGYQGDMRDLPIDTARQIYKKLYWDAIGIVNLPPDVQFTVFDAAVNSGPKQAAKWLQRSVNVDDDGVIGHVTIHACNMLPAAVIVARFNGYRLDFFTRLKTWPVFGAGWARRIATNLMEA